MTFDNVNALKIFCPTSKNDGCIKYYLSCALCLLVNFYIDIVLNELYLNSNVIKPIFPPSFFSCIDSVVSRYLFNLDNRKQGWIQHELVRGSAQGWILIFFRRVVGEF